MTAEFAGFEFRVISSSPSLQFCTRMPKPASATETAHQGLGRKQFAIHLAQFNHIIWMCWATERFVEPRNLGKTEGDI